MPMHCNGQNVGNFHKRTKHCRYDKLQRSKQNLKTALRMRKAYFHEILQLLSGWEKSKKNYFLEENKFPTENCKGSPLIKFSTQPLFCHSHLSWRSCSESASKWKWDEKNTFLFQWFCNKKRSKKGSISSSSSFLFKWHLAFHSMRSTQARASSYESWPHEDWISRYKNNIVFFCVFNNLLTSLCSLWGRRRRAIWASACMEVHSSEEKLQKCRELQSGQAAAPWNSRFFWNSKMLFTLISTSSNKQKKS